MAGIWRRKRREQSGDGGRHEDQMMPAHGKPWKFLKYRPGNDKISVLRRILATTWRKILVIIQQTFFFFFLVIASWTMLSTLGDANMSEAPAYANILRMWKEIDALRVVWIHLLEYLKGRRA